VLRIVLIGLGILGVVAAGLVLWKWDFVVHRIGVVEEGTLYRSAQLDPKKLAEVMDRYRIRTIVDLRERDQEGEKQVVEANGARYVWLPTGQVPPPDVVKRFLEIMDDPSNRPVLLHCEHGVGRTGVLSGVYRMEYDGWDAARALKEARWYALFGSYFDGQDKTRFLERYVPRRDRANREGGPQGE